MAQPSKRKSSDTQRPRAFSGQVKWVEFDTGIGADDYDHLITPEERLLVATAKQ